MKHQQAGFTLIELVIVIILLGILAASITPRFQSIQGNARQNTAAAAAAAVESAALITFAANNGVAVTGASVEAQVNFDGAATIRGGSLSCNAGTDTNFTVDLVGVSPTVSATGTIASEFCSG